jgi:predicted dehydrogenase
MMNGKRKPHKLPYRETPTMPKQLNRRQLLRNTSLAGVGLLLSGPTARAESKSPNEKLDVAVIGAGGRGASNLNAIAPTENIVALCDVDERRSGGSFDKFPKAKKFHDYRRLLDEMEGQIDAVVVSTTNHVHAPATVTAMRMGKHAYCEKPLSHSVFEARVAAQVAAEKKLATQMGTQIHASGNFRRVVELIRAGAVGPVRRCHIWLRGGGSAGDRPTETPPVPKGLDWDLWLGPAPERPYHSCYVPHDWHYWWDFGGGAFGNMGCHYLDLAFWALNLRHPTTIEASGSPVHAESTPKQLHVSYEFAARDDMPPVTVTWSNGPEGPPIYAELPKREGRWAWGVFVGDDGILLANYPKHALLPIEKYADFKPPEPTIPDSVGHHKEWIQACKTGSPTTCNFDYSGAVTETLLLGNIAYRTGKKLQWDPVNLKFPNHPQAEAYLQREYRKGWTL